MAPVEPLDGARGTESARSRTGSRRSPPDDKPPSSLPGYGTWERADGPGGAASVAFQPVGRPRVRVPGREVDRGSDGLSVERSDEPDRRWRTSSRRRPRSASARTLPVVGKRAGADRPVTAMPRSSARGDGECRSSTARGQRHRRSPRPLAACAPDALVSVSR